MTNPTRKELEEYIEQHEKSLTEKWCEISQKAIIGFTSAEMCLGLANEEIIEWREVHKIMETKLRTAREENINLKAENERLRAGSVRI